MSLNNLTLAVSTGVQGAPFRAAITGITAGNTVTLGSKTTVTGGGVLNGVLDHPSLPYAGANTFEIIERNPVTGETNISRPEVSGISVRDAYATGDAALGPGRQPRGRRFVGALQGNGSLVWSVSVTDDYGAEFVTPLGVVAPTVPVNTSLPTVTGTAVEFGLLSTTDGTWSGSPSAFEYRIKRGATIIVGATLPTYSIVTADIGSALTYEVRAYNASGWSAWTPATASATVTASGAPSQLQAARFLAQSTAGFTPTQRGEVVSQGYSTWLDAQIAMARPSGTFRAWLLANGGFAAEAGYGLSENAAYYQILNGNDQVRHAVAMALHSIIVTGLQNLGTLGRRGFVQADFMDIIWGGCFGNYRTLLENVSKSVAMGIYLSFLGNKKANVSTGSQPDENYAREIMQLFSIGLRMLNIDGTEITSGGQPVETYTQSSVSGLARVFTGWDVVGTYDYDDSTVAWSLAPMVNTLANHETGSKTFLGQTIAADAAAGAGQRDLTAALDIIFAHPNVAPYICKQLIQKLVTSNPTPAYVARVARKFEDNGSGVRGDLAAVVKAILLDNEARKSRDAVGADTTFGRKVDPVHMFARMYRGLGGVTPHPETVDGYNTQMMPDGLGQSPVWKPSVFNDYRFNYSPPATAIQSAGLVAPELQIFTDLSAVAVDSWFESLLFNADPTGPPNSGATVTLDYSGLMSLYSTPSALVDEVNLRMYGDLPTGYKTSLSTAIGTLDPVADTDNQRRRVQSAIRGTFYSKYFKVLV